MGRDCVSDAILEKHYRVWVNLQVIAPESIGEGHGIGSVINVYRDVV
jgi:hypothetical protein